MSLMALFPTGAGVSGLDAADRLGGVGEVERRADHWSHRAAADESGE